MTKKATPKRSRAKQRRLSPDDRRREFVAKATEFFSEEGFGGGTRDLARRLGVTQPLLYRYFPSKDDLIKEVYRTVYLEPFDVGWDKLLADADIPKSTRMTRLAHALIWIKACRSVSVRLIIKPCRLQMHRQEEGHVMSNDKIPKKSLR
jgi:AcrR family transcriptional regulator